MIAAPTAKTPLVLLPGLLCDAALWRAQIDGLADIAEVSVGDLTRHESMAAMAAWVLAAAPPRFALAGLSMGGYVAFEITRQAPRRVLKLALIDTSARADTPEQTEQRRAFIELAKTGRFKGVTPRLLPRWIHPSRLDDETLTRAVVEMAQRVGGDAFIRQQTAIMNRPDSRPGLSRIACPTLVLCGREDQATPADRHLEMAADIRTARLVLIEQCGHLSTMERPAEVTRAMRAWLSDD